MYRRRCAEGVPRCAVVCRYARYMPREYYLTTHKIHKRRFMNVSCLNGTYFGLFLDGDALLVSRNPILRSTMVGVIKVQFF